MCVQERECVTVRVRSNVCLYRPVNFTFKFHNLGDACNNAVTCVNLAPLRALQHYHVHYSVIARTLLPGNSYNYFSVCLDWILAVGSKKIRPMRISY